jgi:hypothetical protein
MTKSSKRQASFPKHTYSWSNLPYLSTCHANQNLMVTAPESEKALMASIASVGLATLGNLHDTADLQLSSRKEYDMALRGINSAFSDPI